jgi:hypothetical protein
MENVKLYSIYFLNGQLAILFLVGAISFKKRYQKIISLAITLTAYTWSLFLFFIYKKSEGEWISFVYCLKNAPNNFEYYIYSDNFLFAMFTLLFLIIIAVEFGTMPPKNEEIRELKFEDRVKRRVNERLSEIVTLLFLGAQFCLSHAMFWFYFM